MKQRLEKKISDIICAPDPQRAFDEFQTMANEHTFAGFKTRRGEGLEITQNNNDELGW